VTNGLAYFYKMLPWIIPITFQVLLCTMFWRWGDHVGHFFCLLGHSWKLWVIFEKMPKQMSTIFGYFLLKQYFLDFKRISSFKTWFVVGVNFEKWLDVHIFWLYNLVFNEIFWHFRPFFLLFNNWAISYNQITLFGSSTQYPVLCIVVIVLLFISE